MTSATMRPTAAKSRIANSPIASGTMTSYRFGALRRGFLSEDMSPHKNVGNLCESYAVSTILENKDCFQ